MRQIVVDLIDFIQLFIGVTTRKSFIVIKAFNFVVKIGTCSGNRISIIIPLRLNLLRSKTPILMSFLPSLRLHHVINNAISLKFWEMRMIPCCNRCIFYIRFGKNNIFVSFFKELNIFIARMRIC